MSSLVQHEVDELGEVGVEPMPAQAARLEEVLDRLDVVQGDPLDLGQLGDVSRRRRPRRSSRSGSLLVRR